MTGLSIPHAYLVVVEYAAVWAKYSQTFIDHIYLLLLINFFRQVIVEVVVGYAISVPNASAA
jgi:hypothetical protein